MHLDEEQVQRLLHGQLAAGTESSARDHIATCAECRSRLAEAEREEEWVFERLRRLDHSQPKVDVESIMMPRGRPVPAWGRLAAGIFLALAATGVAYAAPGSPLPRLIEQVIQLIGANLERRVRTTPSAGTGESQAGIAVAPGERLAIVFRGDSTGDTAVVSLTDSAEVIVRARGGTTTFSTESDQLRIGHRGGPAKFEIRIPRMAPLVEVEVRGRRVLMKQNSRLTADVGPDSTGRYLFPLSNSAP
jgi:anti-sigma factor RsiW